MTLASSTQFSTVQITEKAAGLLYEKAARRKWLSEVWQLIRGGKVETLSLLSEEELVQTQSGQRCQISINQIVGSSNQGRTRDFTADFRPKNGRTKARWLSVAKARQQGKRLPPVRLVQKGNRYYVDDGHHRISVAVALGDQTIDAVIS